MLSNFLVIPVVKEKIVNVIKVKFALAIPTRAPTTLVKEMIDTLSHVTLKIIKFLSM